LDTFLDEYILCEIEKKSEKRKRWDFSLSKIQDYLDAPTRKRMKKEKY